MADTPLLEARGLTKRYGSTIALESVDLEITAGVTGVRTAIGLGRGWQSKVLPSLLFFAVMVPAILFSFIASTADRLEDIPTQADYFWIVNIVILLFSATTAPEMLIPDRRDRVLDFYLVRPLTTTDYVIGRWFAFFSIMLALVYAG